jgi:tryptophan synthase beta chain
VGRESGPGSVLLINLSGRGDKDVDTAARWFGLADDPAAVDRTADRPAR